MSWIWITVSSYFLLAISNLGDKFLIDKVLSSSKVYAFLISVLSAIALVLAPWLLEWCGWYWLAVNLLVGAILPWALYFLFESLKRGDASRVTILIGGTIPLFTVLFSLLFLGDSFNFGEWLGMGLLLAGTFFLALVPASQKKSQAKGLFLFVLIAALLYAIFFIGTKYSYDHQSFWSAFIWSRLGAVGMALFFLVPQKSRQEIIGGLTQKGDHPHKKRTQILIYGNQIIGASGSVLQNYAISLGPVALINALQGTQYAFLLIMGFLITIWRPKLLKENIGTKAIVLKVIAIVLISIGLYFITK
ncbi:MAG TPA: DMT family transporter [bacterium]|nr:DMT family transporter [bacterium]HPT29542.1 DMT family transporter [bacterium]